MHKKFFLAMLLMILFVSAASAVNLGEIIESAKSNSISYQTTQLNNEISLLNLKGQEKNEKVGVAVEGEVSPLRVVQNRNLSGEIVAYGEEGLDISTDVTVTLPNDGSTTITSGVKSTTFYEDASTQNNIYVGATHTFDFTGYNSSNSDDLSYTQSRLNTELSLNQSEYSFEQTVISTISNLLTTEKALLTSQNTYEKQQLAVEKMEKLGTYSENSPNYISAKNQLEKLKTSLESSQKSFESLKRSYKNLTGLDWEGIDEIPEPVLELKTYENGNTSVLLKSLSSEMAEERYNALVAKNNPNSLSVNGNVSGNIGTIDNLTISGGASYNQKNWEASTSISGTIGDNKALSITGKVAYKDDNWSVSAAPGVTIKNDKTTPTLTIKGSWNNGVKTTKKVDESMIYSLSGMSTTQNNSTSSLSEEDTLKQYRNNALTAENSYISALFDYQQQSQSLSLEIIDWEQSKAQAEAELSYRNTMLDNEKMMYDLGLSTLSDVEDAERDVKNAEYDWKIVMLKGQSLERELAVFAL